jgi:hypothetical protein
MSGNKVDAVRITESITSTAMTAAVLTHGPSSARREGGHRACVASAMTRDQRARPKSAAHPERQQCGGTLNSNVRFSAVFHAAPSVGIRDLMPTSSSKSSVGNRGIL